MLAPERYPSIHCLSRSWSGVYFGALVHLSQEKPSGTMTLFTSCSCACAVDIATAIALPIIIVLRRKWAWVLISSVLATGAARRAVAGECSALLAALLDAKGNS